MSAPAAHSPHEGTPPVVEPARGGGNRLALLLLVIVAVTLLAYAPALDNGLTNWDDDDYVGANPFFGSLSWSTLQAMFTGYFKGNYHPLTLLSLSLDHALGGGSLVVHHAVSLALHGLDTGLAFLFVSSLLGRARGPLVPSIAALLFGLHPLHVESVAWLSARKDVLYAAFYFAALLAYLRSTRAHGRQRAGAYAVALMLFLCALLSKGMAVTLAPTLVAIDWALGRRPLARSVLLEKLPFFALALAFGLVAVSAQVSTGQLVGVSQWNPLERGVLAAHAYVAYLRLFLLPLDLSAFYPYPAGLGARHLASAVVFLAVAAVFVLACLRRWRGVAFGLLFFTLNVSVVLQLVPIGGALYADRYSYVPSLGLCLVAALGVEACVARGGWVRSAALVGLGIALVGFSAATAQRSEVWADSETLWSDTLAKHPDVHTARMNRAVARIEAGRLEAAAQDLDAALRIEPDDAKAYSYRGIVRHALGDTDGGLEDLDRAVDLGQGAAAFANRGSVRLASGNFTGAIIDFDQTLARDPYSITAYHNRGLARAGQGRWQEALADYAIALQLSPGFGQVHLSRAHAYLALGDSERACEALNHAVQHGIVGAAAVRTSACPAAQSD